MKRSVTAMVVLLTSMLFAVICQAQILATGQLNAARRGHTATLLQDGKILIVGGDDANGLVGQAEIIDPGSLVSSNVAASPIALRTDHTATLLPDGRVLTIGGVDSSGLLGSSELYDPYSIPAPSFSPGPQLQRARGGHTATVLADGKILIVGGESAGSAEIYDPVTQSFSLVSGNLNTPRQYHSAALLNSGKVLIAGGLVGTNTVLDSAEIYDPQTQTFTRANGPMQTPRGLALLRVLPDGKVQVIGGDGEFSMEMFDPDTDSFIALAHVPPHEDYLNSIIASRTRSALITTIIQQNPVLQGQPELTPEITALLNRLDHTVTEIPQSNRALIAGGVNDAGQILSSAIIVSSSAATVTTNKFDYPPGETVTITGQGWQPNETVWMLLHEEPETHEDVIISSVADHQGKFTNTDFAPAQNDLNRSFTLTAIGQLSGATTQTAFKDTSNQVTQIGFGSAPSGFTVGVPNGVGSPLRVEMRNSSGNPETLTGNVVNSSVTLQMTSSSATARFDATSSGCFTSSSITFTINSGSSTNPNTPNFFYRDTTAGSVVLTATVTAKGSGLTNLPLNSTATLNRVVSKANTTTTITSDTPDPSVVGQSYTVNFTVVHQTAGGAGTPTGNVTVSDGTNSCVGTVSGGSCSLTSATAGSKSLSAIYAGDVNFNSSTSATTPHTVSAAGTTTTAANTTTTFSANAQNVTLSATVTSAAGTVNEGTVTFTVKDGATTIGSATTSGTASGGNASVSYALPAATIAKTYTIQAVYNASANYATSSDNGKTLTVQKADTATTATNKTVTISATDQTVNLTAIVTSTAGTVNEGTVTFTVKQGATGIGSAVTSTAITTGSASANFTLPGGTAAGTYTIDVTYSGGTNFNTSSDNTKTLTVQKADTITVAANAGATYSSADQTVSLSATVASAAGTVNQGTVSFTIKTLDGVTTIGVPVTSSTVSSGNASANFTLPANTAAGDYKIEAVYSGGGNFNGSSDTSKKLTVAKAATTTTVIVVDATFDGNPHGGSATVTGPGLNQAVTVSYSGIGGTVYGPSTTAPINSGTYSASASFEESANYLASSDSKNFTINKATPVVTISGGPFTYDGTPHAASVTVTGVGGAPVAGSATLNYGGLPPTSYGPSTTAPTDAGTYQVRSVFTSSDSNYNNAQDTGSITINKAASVTTVTVAGGESFTYDGNAHPATVSVTGNGGLNLAPTPVYSCGHAPIDVADSGCTASYTYAGDANHTGSADSKTYTISKASPTLTVTGGAFTYDGGSHGATTTVTGLGGVTVPGSTTLNYAGVPPTAYGPSTIAPTNAGTYQARALFTSSDVNYMNAQGTASVVIAKADSATALSGTGSFTYDALAHPATANVTGAGGLNQSVPVVYSGNCSAAPVNVNETPCTVNATYPGDANHNSSSASGSIVITKANAAITVNGYIGVYDGSAHGANGAATGIGGVNLNASLNLGAAFINFPGGTANWTFTGGTNYNDASGSVAIVINKRPASVTPNQASKLLGTVDPVPLTTGTLSGFVPADGVVAVYSRTPGETIVGSPYTISATLSPAAALGNYNVTYHTANFYIYYRFNGFFRPIDNLPTVNAANAGSSVPIKFSLNGYQGTSIFAPGYPKSAVMACNGSAPVDFLEEIATPGSSGLSYDPGADQYIYVWKTEKSWNGSCRRLAVTLSDGQTYYADFSFKK